jgi:hypothetical protein
VLASDFAAFPGCWQVVLHLLTSETDHLSLAQEHESAEQQLQQALLAAAQGVAANWPSCGGLMNMQLNLLLQQQQQQQQEALQVSSYPVAAGAAALQDRLVAAAASETAAAPAGHAQAALLDSFASLTGLEVAAAGIYLQPVVLPLAGSLISSSSGNSSSSADNTPVATLCMSQAAARLLQHAGQLELRVVVTAAPYSTSSTAASASESVLLDQTRQFGSMAAEAGTAEHVCLPLPLQLPSSDRPQVLAVTVLADRAAAPGHAMHPSAAVLAKLPLLVLPPAAAAELQALCTGLIAEKGLLPAAAYQEVLPLLQDLAVVLAAAEVGRATAQNQLHEAMLAALQNCFVAHGLTACMELLQPAASNCTCSTADGTATVHATPQLSAAAPTIAATAVAAAASGSQLAPDPAASTKVGRPAKVSRSSSAHVSGSSSSSTLAPTTASHNCVGPAGAAEGWKAASPLAACHVTLWTVLFGFPAAAGQAYAHFKCMEMRRCDVLCMLIYAVGFVPSFSRVLLLLVQGYTANQLLKACFRVLVLATMFAARALVLASTTWPQHVGRLQRWRSAILAGAIHVIFIVPAVAVVCGGVWRDAARAAVGAYHSLPWLLVAYRHVVEPLTMGGGVDALLLLPTCLFIVDPLFGQPQLLMGLGVVPAAAVMALLHLSVAATREYGLQQRFVRQLAAGARATDCCGCKGVDCLGALGVL